MNYLTQEMVDMATGEFKEAVLAMAGDKSLSLAMVTNNKITKELACYEFEIKPSILSQGLVALELSEIFGIKISMKERALK